MNPAPYPMMARRRDATQATLDAWRDRTFQWGRSDCVRLAAFHLRQLGHKPRLARFSAYSSAVGAMRAVRAAGFADLLAAIDAAGFPRIAPASAWLGDVIAMPGLPGLPALVICNGVGGQVIGFHEDGGMALMEPVADPAAYLAAWRCDPA